jgi:predicted GIY-YIG superfamily endonuclease
MAESSPTKGIFGFIWIIVNNQFPSTGQPGARPGHPRLFASAERIGSIPAMSGWVYIMTNRRNGTLYIGVTADFARRVRGTSRRSSRRLHQTVRAETPRLRRAIRRYPDVKATRIEHQALASLVEGAPNSPGEPGLGGSLRSPAVKTWVPTDQVRGLKAHGTSPATGSCLRLLVVEPVTPPSAQQVGRISVAQSAVSR